MNTVNSNITVGKLNFTFTDEDGDIFASFRLNPADVGVAKRWEEAADYFGKRQDNEISSIADVARLNDELEEKICYVLGYDCRKTVFGEVPATTVLPSGEMFAMVVLETVANAVKPELEKRNKKSEAAIAKYTAKYDAV